MRLAAALRAALSEPLRAQADETLEPILAELVASARAAWPGLATGGEELVAYAGARLSGAAPLAETLAGLCAADLFLACAAARGEPAAVAAIASLVGHETDAALARVDLRGFDRADVKQHVRERILVGERPRLLEYGGRGALRTWLRIVALRDALQLLRRAPHETELDSGVALAAAASGSPELEHVKARYRAACEEAFRAALAGLERAERGVLRQHYVHGLTIDEIGAAHGVHRATAARWVARARSLLFARTKDELRARARISDSELSSILRLVRSQIDLSLNRALGDVDG